MKNKILVLLLCLFTTQLAWTQQKYSRQRKANLLRLAEQLKNESELNLKEARLFAEQNDLPIEYDLGDGRKALLAGIEDGVLRYVADRNDNAAITINTDDLFEDGVLGWNLSGEGIEAGIWEAQGVVLASHQEFEGRVTVVNQTNTTNHATHVAGTMIAAGIEPVARGMANKARLLAFDAPNDVAEMATEAANGMLISNHSYGIVHGWTLGNDGWVWTGGNGNNEDPAFGRYGSKARALDQIANDAPNFLICWASGNDRGDGAGQGSPPPDGPYDCVTTECAAKNILAVGAVLPNEGYDGPSSVDMSSFSTWGPVDDGRIKPDIVGCGVGVVSSGANGTSFYYESQGTSMSTPNVSGSLILLQELHERFYGFYMTSAMLKGVTLHTADEAGPRDGPDYQFGWGVANIGHAAEMIAQTNGEDKIMEMMTLDNGQTIEVPIASNGTSPIRVTICWNDPAAPSLTGLNDPSPRLINDLDVRLVHSDGTTMDMPWVLEPGTPSRAASRGDNVLDNVEQVWVEAPAAGNYTIRVTHKGNLQGGQQDFALIAQSSEFTKGETYYWVSQEGGNWSDPTNWSLDASGNQTVDVAPTESDVVIFPSESLSSNSEVTVNGDAACYRFIWRAPSSATLNIQANTLSVKGLLEVTTALNVTGTGEIRLEADEQAANLIRVSNLSAPEATLNFVAEAGVSRWTAIGEYQVGSFTIQSGDFSFDGEVILEADEFNVSDSDAAIDLANTTFNVSHLSFQSGGDGQVNAEQARIVSIVDDFTLTASGIVFGNVNVTANTIGLAGENVFGDVVLSGAALIEDDVEVGQFELLAGASLTLTAGKTLTVNDAFIAEGTDTEFITIQSSGTNRATIFSDYFEQKNCLTFTNVTDVDVAGGSLYVLEESGSLVSGDGWVTGMPCEEVFFPEMLVQYTCVNGIARFTDLSSGAIVTRQWDFGDGSASANDSIATHIYETAGEYTVSLTIADEEENETTRSQTVVVSSGQGISKPEVSLQELGGQRFLNSNVDGQGNNYQWYFEGEAVAGETGTSFIIEQNGEYYLEVENGTCFFRSEPFMVDAFVTGLFGSNLESESLSVFPNPSRTAFTFSFENDAEGLVNYVLHDLTGAVRLQGKELKRSRRFEATVERSRLPAGVYLLRVEVANGSLVRKVVFE